MTMHNIKCVGVLTSGGDSPGMNAAIRAVTRTAIYNDLKVKGIMRGYKGLTDNEVQDFKTNNVSNINSIYTGIITTFCYQIKCLFHIYVKICCNR